MRSLRDETDIEVLRQKALLLEHENTRLVSELVLLKQRLIGLEGKEHKQLLLEIARLEEQLAAHRRHDFAPSTEKQPRKDPEEKKPRPRTGHGRTEQPQLRIVDDIIEDDPADCQCPHCGGELHVMDGQFEESEEIDVIEREFVLRKRKRQKYRCRCGHIETALAQPKLFPKARYSIGFAIQVMVQKYIDHLPLERQVRIYARHGLTVDSQTLFDLLWGIYQLLAPLHERAHGAVLCSHVLHADETRWRMLTPLPPAWHIWTLCTREVVAFFFRDSRRHEVAREIIPDITVDLVGEDRGLPKPVGAPKLLRNDERVLMSDDYDAYSKLADARPGMLHALCWAHARRKFEELKDVYPGPVAEILEMIAELYRTDHEVPAGAEHDPLRRRNREENCTPIVEKIFAWASKQQALPRSKLSEALHYLTSNRAGLTVFLLDPQVPLDNNLGERTERGPVVGRKNHYGSKSERGIRVAELAYTLVETAKLSKVDPAHYLDAVIHDALDGKPLLLPHEMKDRLAQYQRGPPQPGRRRTRDPAGPPRPDAGAQDENRPG